MTGVAQIRVTRLPPDFEQTVPLAFANCEQLAYAVAITLHRRAWPLRVALIDTHGVKSLEKLGRIKPESADDDTAFYAEYVPPDSYSAEPTHYA
jgi:hypothetical protein